MLRDVLDDLSASGFGHGQATEAMLINRYIRKQFAHFTPDARNALTLILADIALGRHRESDEKHA